MGWGSGNLGGGGSAWAMVLVNYPSGSTLTATNVSGKKDISSTQRLYYVKKPSSGTTQSVVLTITDGTQTKSQTVSLTIGTAQTITMSYSYSLLPISGASSYWKQTRFHQGSSAGTTTITDSLITCRCGDGANNTGAGTLQTYDNSTYSKVKIHVSAYNPNAYSSYWLCLSQDDNLAKDNALASVQITAVGDYELDLLSTACYISFGIGGGGGYTTNSISVDEVTLE